MSVTAHTPPMAIMLSYNISLQYSILHRQNYFISVITNINLTLTVILILDNTIIFHSKKEINVNIHTTCNIENYVEYIL